MVFLAAVCALLYVNRVEFLISSSSSGRMMEEYVGSPPLEDGWRLDDDGDDENNLECAD